MTGRQWMAAAGAAALVAGCATGQEADRPRAQADLRTSTGADAGKALAEQVDGGVRVMVDAIGLPPGIHGVHVHTTGRCDAPDFASAGGHWNPAARKHGLENPAGPHAGDMPNLTVTSDGTGQVEFTLPGGTFAGLLEGDGSAFVVHAAADDMKTDPSGNSGGRIACGVFQPA